MAPVARALTGSRPRVLFYHRFGEGNRRHMSGREFEQQVRYLRRHFKLVPLSVITSALAEGKPLPRKVVALTVDDGYADFIHTAYPVIKKYRVPITVFVVSEFAKKDTWLWYDRVRFICTNAPAAELTIGVLDKTFRFSFENNEAREQAWDSFCSWCVGLSTEDRMHAIGLLEQATQVQVPVNPPDKFKGLTVENMLSMDPTLVEIGAHTRTHVILSRCSEEEQREEIEGSKHALEALLHRQVAHFAYPNGQDADFNETSVRLVQSSGMKAAVTVKGSLIEKSVDLFKVPRLCASTDAAVFHNEVNGVSHLKNRMLAWAFGKRRKEIA